MARRGIDKDFLIEIAKLDRPVVTKVGEVFGKFAEATHTGIHLEPIRSARANGCTRSESTTTGAGSF